MQKKEQKFDKIFSVYSTKEYKKTYVRNFFNENPQEERFPFESDIFIKHQMADITNNIKSPKIVFVRQQNGSISSTVIGIVMREVLKKLNIDFFYIGPDQLRLLNGIDNSVVVFIAHPGYYLRKFNKCIEKRNNIFVLWNFEPLVLNINKSINNIYESAISLADKSVGEIDFLFLHSMWQAQQMSKTYNNCFFLPVGYDECFEPKQYKQEFFSRPSLCFLGKLMGEKDKIITKINKKNQIVILDKINYTTHENRINKLSCASVGLDVLVDNKLSGKSISWMRNVLYTACGAAIMSGHPLELDFTEEHYIRFDGTKHANQIIKNINLDKYDLEKINKNAKNKMIRDLYMMDLFKNCLDSIDRSLITNLQNKGANYV